MRLVHTALLGGLLGLWITAGANGQLVPPHGGLPPFRYLSSSDWGTNINKTHGAATPDYRDIIVGYLFIDRPGTDDDEYRTLDDIVVNLLPTQPPATGVRVERSMYLYRNSVVNVLPANAMFPVAPIISSLNNPGDGVFLFDDSKFNVSGGTVRRPITASDNATVSVTGGDIESLIGRGDSTLRLK